MDFNPPLPDLPLLKLIQGNGNNFLRFGHAHVRNIPLQHAVTLQLRSSAFSDVVDLNIEDSPLLDDWMKNHMAAAPFISESLYTTLDASVEIIILEENCMNDPTITQFSLNQFPLLQLVHIKSLSFAYVSTVIIDSLFDLRCVIIDDWCFTARSNTASCFIQNCKSLQEVYIGNHSMEDYSMLHIRETEALRIIHIDSHCFKKCTELELSGTL